MYRLAKKIALPEAGKERGPSQPASKLARDRTLAAKYNCQAVGSADFTGAAICREAEAWADTQGATGVRALASVNVDHAKGSATLASNAVVKVPAKSELVGIGNDCAFVDFPNLTMNIV